VTERAGAGDLPDPGVGVLDEPPDPPGTPGEAAPGRRRPRRLVLVAAATAVVLALVAVAVVVRHERSPEGGGAPPRPGAPISQGAPAYASSGADTAAGADDGKGDTAWRSSGVPAWLAYDLAGVPAAHRGRVLAAWSNTSYAYSTRTSPHYNGLGAYTVQVNDDARATSPPTTGWVTKVSVTGNVLHSRQHLLDLGGARWVRLSVTASDGSALNTDASVNAFDLYDLSALPRGARVPDDAVFYGDSITAAALCPCDQEGTPALAELLHAAHPDRFPLVENAGEPFLTSQGAVDALLGPHGYLSLFPGTQVALAYGMNDAASRTGTDAYYANMKKLVQAVLAAGATPLIPTISWTAKPDVNAEIPAYNAVVARLYREFPQVVEGPDLWSYFKAHPGLVNPGDIHPSPQGSAALRRQWATTLLATLYHEQGAPSGPAGPSPAPVAPARTGLHVVGNRILDGAGAPVRLIGVNHSGSEYACVGGGTAGATGYAVFEPADFDRRPDYLTAIRSWGTNTVRLGLNEACWLGLPGVAPAFSGAAYRAAVQRYVAEATRAGLDTVLELHWSAPGTGAAFVPHGQAPMPDRDHSPAFWRSVADTFKSNTAVVLDLFNEPFPHDNRDTEDAWACWRDGTVAADPGNTRHCVGTAWYDTAGNAARGGKPYAYAVAGMQELLDAVRSTGAENLVLLAGVQYANSLSRWSEYAPHDPAGNIAASWHVYPSNTCSSARCWDSTVAPLARTTPLVTTEVGDQDCGTTFAEPLLSWLDRRGAGYLAWTWNTWGCGGLQLMTDYASGTPTEVGRPLRDHLRRVADGLAAAAGGPAR
jgi:lysophospholipase L1-like esterase